LGFFHILLEKTGLWAAPKVESQLPGLGYHGVRATALELVELECQLVLQSAQAGLAHHDAFENLL
jgi:hypothetical protein